MTTVHPIPIPRRPLPTRVERVSAAVVRRAVPVLAGSAATLVATLAAERAIREVALGAMERFGAREEVTTDYMRTVVTEVIVHRSLRRA